MFNNTKEKIKDLKEREVFLDADLEQDHVKVVEEMAHYLELTIENIYFNQEVTEVLDSTFNLLENITFVLIMAVIVIGVFLSFGIVGYIISLFG